VKQVLNTTDRSLAESLLIALEAEGIEAIMLNEAGSSLPFVPVTIAITADTEYDRTLAIMRALESTPRAAPSAESAGLGRSWRVVLAVLVALGLIVCMQIG